MKNISCSIIINTLNRSSRLRKLLPALQHLRGGPFEVVVVNGPSTDETKLLLEQYNGRIKAVNCSTANLSMSRNLGILAASGDIVVFIDDDAFPADELWLERYLDVFRKDNEGKLAAAGGPVLHRDTDRFEFNGGATSDYGLHIFDSAANQIPDNGDRWTRGVPGGNSAFRRDTLLAIGGYDEFYTYYMDESDVCMRLNRAGLKISYLPDNPIRHYAARSEKKNAAFSHKWFVITRSDTYYAMKNGSDPLPLRILKTFQSARTKHYYSEISALLRDAHYSLIARTGLLFQWIGGFCIGLTAGIANSRKVLDGMPSNTKLTPFITSSPAKPLRIALLTQAIPGQPNNGGIGRYTWDLACGLHEMGHEVHIICKNENIWQNESLKFEIHGIPYRQYAVEEKTDRPIEAKNLKYSSAVYKKIMELKNRGIEFDVVHASNWDCEAVHLIRSKLCPTVLMLVTPLAQVAITERWSVNADIKAYVALDRWQILNADTVCAPSKGVMKSYRELMEIKDNEIPHLEITPLGIVPDLNPEGKQTEHMHRLLFVGRCERRKGVHVLLNVLPEILSEHKDWECHMIGDDSQRLPSGETMKQKFLDRHKTAKWLTRVIFHGIVSETDLKEHYRGCDLFVAPSLFESFGLIYHEAMQYGKAVIGCRTGGIPEVVEDGTEGLLVTPDDSDALKNAIERLICNEELRLKMGQAAARRIREKTNYLTMAKCIEEVYRETISRAKRRINESC